MFPRCLSFSLFVQRKLFIHDVLYAEKALKEKKSNI